MPFSLYRAEVLNARDPEKRGKIGLYIPDIQGSKGRSKDNVIWAMPATSSFSGSPNGGSNVNCGSLLIPPEGTFVFCFKEKESAAMWYYLSGPMFDDNSNCMPEEGKVGSEYEKNYVLLRTPKGRAIILSDEPTNQSLVFKGKGSASTSKLVQSTDMALVMEEGSNGNIITLQSGNGKQYVKINKDTGETLIQNNGSVYIRMTSDSIIIKAPGGIYLN